MVQKTTVQSMAPGRADVASRFAAIIAFLGSALLGGQPVWASNEEALAHFNEGQAAFAAEDFSKARALFEQALAAGMEGPAIQYNIGAAAYLGGDLPRAERAFLEVARTPSMAALAHYNLGLVALQRRDEREARDWFEQTTQDVPDERLAALALERLAELPEARAPGYFSYYTRAGAGYDDNISLRSVRSRARQLAMKIRMASSSSGAAIHLATGESIRPRQCSGTRTSMNSIRPHFLWAVHAASGWKIGTSSSVRTARNFHSAERSSSKTWGSERRRRARFTTEAG
jgi:tetratricopeptide (TPR) repeat protein